MDHPMEYPKRDRSGGIHGPLFQGGFNWHIRSDFWVATNPHHKDRVNIKFNDPNRISVLFDAMDCRQMALALLHLADELDRV
jgi:hypothetical protein